MCKASIIIPAYNAEAYIEETLKSVQQQTFHDLEILVIDDGSTDSTGDRVLQMAELDSRIRYIRQSNSGGPAKPRNIGLSESIGEYIFIFDSDDVMVPRKVEISIGALDKEPNADLLFSNFSSIDEKGILIKENYLENYDSLWNITSGKSSHKQYYFLPFELFFTPLLKANFIGTSSVVLRRSALKDKDHFDESLTNADDYLFWVTFLKGKNAIFVDEVLHFYRVLKTGISNRSYLKRGPSRISALKKIRKQNSEKFNSIVISKKIANEYFSMAYAYSLQGDRFNQRKFALDSMKERFSVKALKLYALSFMERLAK